MTDAILKTDTADDGFGYARDLKGDARRAAAALGHDLAPFRPRPYDRNIYNANCTRCLALACVNAAPVPGEPAIYGPATDSRCKETRE